MVNYRKFKLKNGLEVVFSDIPHREDIGIHIVCRVGSNYEIKELNGMSHFLEHMCFKGTLNRDKLKIIEDFAKIGATYNAATSDDYTTYYGISHKRYWKKLLDIILDIYLNSTFPKKEINLERNVVIEEMNMYNNDEEHVLHSNLLEKLYGDQPAGRTILGLKQNVRRFKRDDLVEFKKKYYTPNNTFIMVIGDLDNNMNNILSIIKEKVEKLKRGKKNKVIKVYDKQKGIRFRFLHQYIPQSTLQFVFRAGKAENESIFKYELLSIIIGGGPNSRLYKLLREDKGLSYHSSAHLEYSSDHGFMTIEVGVDNEKLLETITIVMNMLKDLKKNLISDKEIKLAKKLLNTQEELSLETHEDYSNYLEKYLVYQKKIDKLPARIKKRNSVTSRQLLNLAKRFFINSKFVFVYLGPKTKTKKIERLLTF